jgi:glucans biosynthesis protein C
VDVLVSPPTTRRHDLDAIRAAALLLGIALHACLSFMPGVGGDLWPISDNSKSTTLAVLFFVIHVFRMTVFFLIAGLLSRALLASRGWQGFLQNRAKRVLAPLVLAWGPCFVLVAVAALWAMARANGGTLPDPLPAAALENGFSFLHLWFLYELLWLYGLTLAARAVVQALDRDGAWRAVVDVKLRAALSSTVGVVLLSSPVGLAMSLIPAAELWMGIPTPGFTWLPPATSLFIYAYVFWIGWALHRQRDVLALMAHRWRINGLLGLVCAGFFLMAGGSGFSAANHLVAPVALAFAYGLAVVAWTLAFVGLGTQYFDQPKPIVRYLADASYWMYIAHLPLVMLLQTALMLAPLHWSLKFAAINLVCLVLLLLSYHHGVRSTWIGQLLNGHKNPKGPMLAAMRGHDVSRSNA